MSAKITAEDLRCAATAAGMTLIPRGDEGFLIKDSPDGIFELYVWDTPKGRRFLRAALRGLAEMGEEKDRA